MEEPSHLSEKKENEIKKRKKKKLIIFILFISIYAIVGFSLSIAYSKTVEKQFYKTTIQNDITIAIKKDVDIDTIKNIYENRELFDYSYGYEKFIKPFLKNFYVFDKTYNENTPLSKILIDIKTNMYLDESTEIDKVFKDRLDKLILKYLEVNPFDSLNNSEKENFKEIRLKLYQVNQYDIIKNNLEKIALEMSSKNKTINEYLSDSSMSLNISIFAIIYSILISIFSFYPNIKKIFSKNKDDKKIDNEQS